MGNQVKMNPSQKKTYSNRDFAGNVEKLYLNTKSSDINFLFGSSTDSTAVSRVGAHKILLAVASDVFDAMFYGELKETGDIEITDASREAFIEFLQFSYLNEVQLTEENIAEVIYLGHKYQFESCIDACIQFLKDNLTAESIFSSLDIAILYNQQELTKICERFIIVNTVAVFRSDNLLQCSKISLTHILNMKILPCLEGHIFEACMAWVKGKCEKEANLTRELVEVHLGELYYKIQFASMSVQELCILAEKYKYVLRDDFIEITNMIAQPGFQSKDFNTSPRKIEWNCDAAIKCSFKNGYKWRYQFLKRETTTFSSNEPLLLGGFTCGAIVFEGKTVRDLSADLPVEIEIFEISDTDSFLMGTKESKLEMKYNLKSTDTKVVISRPVLILPGFYYAISIGPFPDGHIYYSEVLKTEIQLQPNIEVKLHKCNTAISPDATRNGEKIGLIWALDFNRI